MTYTTNWKFYLTGSHTRHTVRHRIVKPPFQMATKTKITVSLDDDLVQLIDLATKNLKGGRSRWLNDVAKRKVYAKHRGKKRVAQIRQARIKNTDSLKAIA